jgi:hypothetical protein
MIELQERKRLLVLQSELDRASLCVECARLGARLSWMQNTQEKVRSASPWLALGAAAVGLLAARRGRKLARWLPTVLTVWRWIQRLKAG